MPAAAPPKPREKRGLQIINPSTGKSIFDTDEPATSTTTSASTSSSSTTAAPPPELAQAPVTESKKPVSHIAAEFAAKVAAVADSVNKVEEPARPQHAEEMGTRPSPPVEVQPRPLLEEALHEPLDLPTDQLKAESSAVAAPAPASAIEVSPSTPTQDQELLSVVTEVKREDSLYEPVSPTPLPDSPVDEVRGGQQQQQEDKKLLSPQLSGDDGFTETKGRKKKSLASKRAELNRKGLEKEKKGGDLLEVFTEAAGPAKKQEQQQQQPPAKAEEQLPPPPHRPPPEPLLEPLPPVETAPAAPPARPMKEPTPLLSPTPPPLMAEPAITSSSRAEAAASSSAPAFNLNGLLNSLPPQMQRGSGVGNHVGENHINNHVEDEEEEDLEEGELPHSDDETPGSREPRPKTLKYEYKEDQWSPLNPEGKKQYDREFLICLQNDPLSMQKPSNLPVMEIIKDKPNVKRESAAPFRGFDFTPSYVHPTTSRQGINKRASKSKEPIKPVRVIQIPSFSQDVQLHKADNAWTPLAIAKKKGADIKQDELDDLSKKVRAILNKLTPQKFSTLVEQFQDLPIDSQAKLTTAMQLIFEKALDEPAFSVAYAQMCRVLQLKKVPVEGEDGAPIPGTEVAFRKLLITRCQSEFEKDYMEGLDKDQYLAQMADPNLDEAEKKKKKDEFEAMEMRARRRSLGNIRFIGELYKLQMLTVRIMHECVAKLLKEVDEESLECLCRLMTTVGQELEADTKVRLEKGGEQAVRLRPIDFYFREMLKIINEKKTSSRVRFLMQDVVDLRNNRWQKRREDAGPKTIDQIHEEVKNEQLKEKLNLMAPPPPPPSSGRGGGGGGGRDLRDDQRKRSIKLASGGGGGGSGGQSEDGWQPAPTRAAKVGNEKFDTNKLKNIISKRENIEEIQLGPSRKGWGQGSAGTKSSSRHGESAGNGSSAGTVMHNKFSALSSSSESSTSGPPASYDGRTSGGYGGRSSRSGLSSSSGGGSGPASSSYMGRSSRGQSFDDKAKVLQAVREMGSLSGRSTSTMAAPPSRSEAVSHPPLGTKSASMMAPLSSGTEYQLKGREDTDRQELEKKSKACIEEFLSVCDYNEAYQCICELFHPSTVSVFVSVAYDTVLEGPAKARKDVGQLLSDLVRKQILSHTEYLGGISGLLEAAADMLVDVPKFWDFIAAVLAPALLDASLPMKFIQTSCSVLPEQNMASKYVAAVLHEMARVSPEQAGELWQTSGLRLEDFLTEDQNVEEFIRSNKLEFSREKSGGGSSQQQQQQQPWSHLSSLLARPATSNEEIIAYLDQALASQVEETQFIRSIVTAVVESALDGLGGPNVRVKLNDKILINRCPILVKYVDAKTENELQALLALQRLMVRLEHPTKLLHSILQIFYDHDAISADGCQLWMKNSDPAEQEGKGVALKSCVQLITWMSEPDDEETSQP